jgi:hypothetical protein
MATAAEGNVLHVPGQGSVAEVKGEEVLGSYARFTQKGLTIKSGAGVLKAGTLLKTSSTAKKYDGVANSSGISSTIGILRKPVDASSSDMLANYILSGVVKASMLRYADGTSVASSEYDDVATALNGHYDSTHGFISF